MLKEIGVIEFNPKQWERFKNGELLNLWAKTYPNIFDSQDMEIARNQAPPPMNYHFFEWLAAVILYESFGYLSLVEQYEFRVHERKQAVIRKFLPDSVFKLVTDHAKLFGRIQGPDLFVYAPDYSDWFFCEVKGPRDRLSEAQIRYFDALSLESGKDIRVIRFKVTGS